MDLYQAQTLIFDKYRLLARRDSTPEHPIVDETMETARLKAADLFFKFQDAVEHSLGAKASDYLDALLPYCLDIQQQVQSNEKFLKWVETDQVKA